MQSFKTLLQREWMQHKLGWLIVMFAPMAIGLVVLGIGDVQFNINDSEASEKLSQLPAVGLALTATIATAALTFLIAWATSLIQAPGLARRDQQDRSIEFWLSLPTGHGSSVAAPMLAHLLLFPLAAFTVGLLGGQLIALVVVTRFAGFGEWLGLPWGSVLAVVGALAARLVLGLLLATLWLSPLILLTMAASAWLKRWGLPAVIAFFVVIGNLADKLYGNRLILDTLSRLGENAGRAFISPRQGSGLQFRPGEDPTNALAAFPGWIAHDAMNALAATMQPLMLGALVFAAACFWLLVLRRQRGA